MRIRLESKPAKLLALGATIVLLAPYCLVAGGRYRASRIAEGTDRGSLERIIHMEPGNAEFRERLARYRLYTEQDAAGALQDYQVAASLNPYSASNWLGVAQTQFILGNQSASVEAAQRAIETDPMTPSVAWEAANLFVTGGRIEPALKEIRFVLANDPGMLLQGLQLIQGLERFDPDAIRMGLPPIPIVYQTLINLMTQQGKIEEAKMVWPALIGLHQRFDPKPSFFFLNTLIRGGDGRTALRFWNEMGKEVAEVGRLSEPGNLIHNPSFEYDTLNGGFDWLYLSSPEVDLKSEVSDAHEGRRSLLVTFLGERTSEIGMRQYVVLEPNTKYRFHGFMKSDLQTANGVQFIMLDTNNNNRRLMETEDSVDDRQWKEFSAEFVTAPNTELSLILIGRNSGTLVRGNVLVDDLRLEKVRP